MKAHKMANKPTQFHALFVTGPPASGKSTVAAALAQALPDFALLEKDLLKEVLYDATLQSAPTALTASRKLSDAAIGLLWTLAQRCPRVILEANFHTLDPRERARFESLDANKLEVHCVCPFKVAARRFAVRAASRHPAHTVHELSGEVFKESASPFGLSSLIEVDTANPLDLSGLIKQIRSHWPEL